MKKIVLFVEECGNEWIEITTSMSDEVFNKMKKDFVYNEITDLYYEKSDYERVVTRLKEKLKMYATDLGPRLM